jgi:hypothetical protein
MQCVKDAIEFYNLGLGEYYTLHIQEVELEIYWMH